MKIQTMTILLVGTGLLTLTTTLAQSSDQATDPNPAAEKKCCAQEGGQGKCGGKGCCRDQESDGKAGEKAGENAGENAGEKGGGQGDGACGKECQGQCGHAAGGHGASGKQKQHRGGKGHGHDARHAEDRDVFHFLLSNHEKISRQVTELPDGVETLTESELPEIAAKIKEHVRWMQHRVENAKPIRRRDPLFDEIFKHTDKIQMKREETAAGVRVVETSQDPFVAKLIKQHAKTVSGFVSRGFAEARLNHAIPVKDADQPTNRVEVNEN